MLSASGAMAAELNVYSAQKEHLIRPILDDFTKDTGIKINLISAEDAGLVVRLEQEGDKTPADVFLVSDIANIYRAKSKGLLKPIKSEVLNATIPAHWRSPEGDWYGFTTRSRAIFYAKSRTNPNEVKTYADLADPKWKGKVLIRSSANTYNQSLLASIIAHDGKEKALAWAKGIVANMARTPQGGDRDQMLAVIAGEGDLAVANTYYYGLLLKSEIPAEREAAAKLGVIFPNQATTGTHTNIRGGGVVEYTKHEADAVKLMEYLVSDKAQKFFSVANNEYPVKAGIPAPDTLKPWGDFKRDDLNLEEVGKLIPEAVKIFDEAGWK